MNLTERHKLLSHFTISKVNEMVKEKVKDYEKTLPLSDSERSIYEDVLFVGAMLILNNLPKDEEATNE